MKNKCSCAWCMGIAPWTSRFAQCIQEGWIIAEKAVEQGIACAVPIPESDDDQDSGHFVQFEEIF